MIMKNIHVEKVNDAERVKDVEYEEEGEDIFHSGFRTDNEGINESDMRTF